MDNCPNFVLEICPKNKFQFQIKLLNKDKAKLLQK